MSYSYSEAVKKTVKWWSKKSFGTPLNQNNGDDSDTGGIAFLLMNSLAMTAQQRVTEKEIALFEEKLEEELLKGETEGYYGRLLMVDYHPCKKLQIACDAAGIDTSCLPIKTTSHILEDNKPMGAYQYGGKWEEIL